MLAQATRRATARGHRGFSLNTSLTPIAAALIACMAFNAHAAETTLEEVKVRSSRERADGPVDGYRATRSSTVTKTDTPLRDVPQSVQVIPEALIKDQAMHSMAQVIRYVPGATMNPGEGGRDQPVLRGISTNADFYIDGIRDDGLYFRDPYNAERIEILKGPSGMTFGRGGAGGVINRVTKRPLDVAKRQFDLSLGSDDAKRATLDIGGRFGNTAGSAGYRVNAMVEDAGSFRDGVSLRRSGVNPVFEFFPGEATSVVVGYEHFEDRRTIDRGIPSQGGAPYETARETFFGNADLSKGRGRVDALSARVEHQLAPHVVLRNNLRVTDYSTFRQNVQVAAAVNASGIVPISAYNSSNERTNIFNQTEAEMRLTLGGMEHLVLAGAEIGRQRSDNTRVTGFFNGAERINVSALTPLATPTEWRAKASDANNLARANIAGIYVQDQITLTPQWKAVAGVRYDRFKVEIDDRRATPVDLARTDTEASPRAGLIYQPSAGQSYYASYSYAFLPSGESLALAANNTELEPEKAKNWEIGAKWDLTPGLSATAAVFRLDRANVKATDPNDPTRLQLTGLQRTEGIELGIQGQVTDRWQVYAGYARLDAEIKEATTVPAGTKVALVPRHAASLWNRVDLTAGWSVGLGVVHQGEVYASSSNLVTLPSYTRVDGAVFYQIDKNMRLALNLENLADRRYYATAGGDNNIIPGTPRSARLSLSMGF